MGFDDPSVHVEHGFVHELRCAFEDGEQMCQRPSLDSGTRFLACVTNSMKLRRSHWLCFVSVFDMRSSLNGLPAELSGGRFSLRSLRVLLLPSFGIAGEGPASNVPSGLARSRSAAPRSGIRTHMSGAFLRNGPKTIRPAP